MSAGSGLAVVVNANAKRGGRRVAVQIKERLPGANVRLTKSVDEIERWLKVIGRPRCLLAAGGDGSAVALVNALDRVTPAGESFPMVGLLPLGTGNGWAHSVSAPKLDRCLRILESAHDKLPVRRFTIFEVGGSLAHFAGSGWDAMIIEDYKAQLRATPNGPAHAVSKSVYGYLTATFLRTVPKVTLFGNPHVMIENLGDDAFTMTADGKLLRIHGAAHGAVLYDGPFGVASCATSPEFGYGFVAFPFAERLPGYMNVRVYDRTGLQALPNIPKLWQGKHPMHGMHEWFAKSVRMTFSRPVPLQIGGDAHGMVRSAEYRVSPRVIELLDWRRLI